MSVRDEIREFLQLTNMSAGSWRIANNIKRPEPSVRRTLVQMYRDGVINRDNSPPYLYELAS